MLYLEDLQDLTVVIPYTNDSPARERNFKYCTQYWRDNGKEPVIAESPLHPEGIYSKSKICNDTYKKIGKGIIYMCDVDTIPNLENIRNAYWAIKNDPKTYVLPFQHCKNIDPENYHSTFAEFNQYPKINVGPGHQPSLNWDNIVTRIYPGRKRWCLPVSDLRYWEMGVKYHMGYGCMFDYAAYADIGLDNEYFYHYDFEDMERLIRMKGFGFDIRWLKGDILHMDHGNLPIDGNPVRKVTKYIAHNMWETIKVCNLQEDELRAYVDTWPWKP